MASMPASHSRLQQSGAVMTVLLAAMFGGAGIAAQTPVQPAAGDIVLRGGWLFDGTGDSVVPNTGILVRDGTFLEVGAQLQGKDVSPARVIELADSDYVLPGFFDLHAHYAVDLFGEGRVDEYQVNPILFLANGVTSTFPAGEVDPEGMEMARRRIDAGQQIGPRIYNSGRYFGTARPGWKSSAMTPDSIRAEVDYWAARGVRGFKAKGIRPEQLRALIDQAHRHGLTVTAHLGSGFHGTVNPRDAILMGIDRVEHFIGGDALPSDRPAYTSLEALDAASPEVGRAIADFVEHHVFFDATLTAYGYFGHREPAVYEDWAHAMDFLTPYARSVVEARLPRHVSEQFDSIYYVKRKVVRRFFEEGGAELLTLGTDHPSWGEFFSGFGTDRELHALVLAGIPPAAALRIGTIHGARALGVASKLGSIEPGKFADLVVVRGNPLEDIRNTRHARLVMKAGELYDPAKLLASVRGRMGPEGPAEADRWKGNVRYATGQGGDRGGRR